MWGRRSVAIGALLVAIALIGGLILLLTGGGDDSGSGGKPVVSLAQLQDRFLKHTVADASKGISVRRPGDWTDSKRADAITLQSHDRCLSMTLSAPTAAGRANRLHQDSLALFRRSYRGVRVSTAPASQLGGIPTTSNAIKFTDDKGNPLTVLLSVGTGRQHAYLTEVVVGNPSCQGALQRARLVLSSVEYTK